MSEKFPLGRVLFWAGLAIGVSVLQTRGGIEPDPTPEAQTGILQGSATGPVLAQARKRAQRELPTFLKIAKADPVGWQLAALKIALPTDTGSAPVWVDDFTRLRGQTYEGRVMTDAPALPALGIGDRVTFSFDQVDDFAFVEGGVGYGFYSLRAILPLMSDSQAAQTGGFLSGDPLPGYW